MSGINRTNRTMRAVIILILLLAGGCATSKPESYDLLYREGPNNLARSVLGPK